MAGSAQAGVGGTGNTGNTATATDGGSAQAGAGGTPGNTGNRTATATDGPRRFGSSRRRRHRQHRQHRRGDPGTGIAIASSGGSGDENHPAMRLLRSTPAVPYSSVNAPPGAGIGSVSNDNNTATATNTGADSLTLAQAGVGGEGNSGNEATATNSGNPPPALPAPRPALALTETPATPATLRPPPIAATTAVRSPRPARRRSGNTGNEATATNSGKSSDTIAYAGTGGDLNHRQHRHRHQQRQNQPLYQRRRRH